VPISIKRGIPRSNTDLKEVDRRARDPKRETQKEYRQTEGTYSHIVLRNACKQKMVAASSCEAEYIAAFNLTKDNDNTWHFISCLLKGINCLLTTSNIADIQSLHLHGRYSP
jgi:hypothetical protein